MTAAIDAHHRAGPRWHDMAAGYYHRHDMAAGAMREDDKAAIKNQLSKDDHPC
jgi:hypothetical protein